MTAAPSGMSKRFLEVVLRAAVKKNDVDLVRSILASGADPNAAEENGPLKGWTPAMMAASEGSAESLVALLESGADHSARLVDARGAGDVSPALEAASEGHAGCLLALLEAGAMVEERGRWNMSLGMIAATMNMATTRNESGKLECLRILLERGASLRGIDDTGRSLMDYAQEYGSPECARLVQIESERRIIAQQTMEPGRSVNQPRL